MYSIRYDKISPSCYKFNVIVIIFSGQGYRAKLFLFSLHHMVDLYSNTNNRDVYNYFILLKEYKRGCNWYNNTVNFTISKFRINFLSKTAMLKY